MLLNRRRALLSSLALIAVPGCAARAPRSYSPSERAQPMVEMERGLPALPVTLRLPRFPSGASLSVLADGSLRRIVAETVPQSPMVRQALFEVAAAGAEVARVDARRGPSLGVDSRAGYGEADPNARRRDVLGGVQGAFTIFDNGASALREDGARWNVAGAAASLWEKVEAVSHNVCEAALSRRKGEALLVLAGEQVRGFERLLSAVRVGVNAEVAAPADLPEAEARLERVRASRIAARTVSENAAAAMRRTVGVDVDPDLRDLVFSRPEGTPEALAEFHPSVQAGDAAIRAALKEAMAVDAERLGSLSLGVSPGVAVEMFGSGGVWLLASAFLRAVLPIIDSGERDARLRAATARVEIAMARRRDGALAVAAMIRRADIALRAAVETERLARREGEAARRLLDRKSGEWRMSTGDLRSVLDAQQALTDSASKAEEARWDRRISEVSLMAACGTLARHLGAVDGEVVDMMSAEPYRHASALLRDTPLAN